jgi:hypothetical protein
VGSLFDLYQAAYPYRLVFGLLFFATLGTIDLVRHPENPRRAKEYAFLLFSTALAVAYGTVHDQVTVTISPEYFLNGKEIRTEGRPLRVAVAILAVQATYWVGLLSGAALLIANNPAARPQLPYRALARICAIPLICAAAGAALGSAVFALDPFGAGPVACELGGESGPLRFLVVWGIHAGSYLGGLAGAIAAVVAVRRARR